MNKLKVIIMAAFLVFAACSSSKTKASEIHSLPKNKIEVNAPITGLSFKEYNIKYSRKITRSIEAYFRVEDSVSAVSENPKYNVGAEYSFDHMIIPGQWTFLGDVRLSPKKPAYPSFSFRYTYVF